MNKIIFKNAKDKYEQIKAPESLRKSVEKIFDEKPKQNRISKYVVGAVASIVVCFTIALNVSPTFAANIANNEFMKDIVKVLTANKYEISKNNMVAKIVTPKIDGISNITVEEKINNEIETMMNEIIANFESETAELEKNYPDAHYGIDADYIVKTDNEKYLSVDIYVVNTVGSSSTVHKFYNFDKTTGEVIHLKDIIKEDYIEDVAKIIETEIEKRNKEEGHEIYYATYDEIVELLNKKEEFYINENGKPVIVFDKYEIGIGAIGCPEFEINI